MPAPRLSALTGAEIFVKHENMQATASFKERGAVKVDGVDVRDYAQHSLRRHVGLVLQDVFLFAGTIESNLTLNDTSIPHERVIEACKYDGVHDYILSLENGYQTEVRERGATLSTGQKQLLAISGVLVMRPDYVVLDEPTTLLDLRNRNRVAAAIRALPQTAIVVTHDLELLHDFERVLVFDDGRVLADGAPAEALRVYRERMA